MLLDLANRLYPEIAVDIAKHIARANESLVSTLRQRRKALQTAETPSLYPRSFDMPFKTSCAPMAESRSNFSPPVSEVYCFALRSENSG
jgi:hypothetical protein